MDSFSGIYPIPSNAVSGFEHVTPSDVIIGRGRKIKEHPGNQRFYSLVRHYMDSYASAPTKTKKSLIILKILNEVRLNNDGNFVKLDADGGHPIIVEETASRVTIAQTLRDVLNVNYKSSRQHKQRRRLLKKRATAINAQAGNHFNGMTTTDIDIDMNTSMNLNMVFGMKAKSVLQSFQPLSRRMSSTLALTRQVSSGSSGNNTACSPPENNNSDSIFMGIRHILDDAVVEASTEENPFFQEDEQTVMDDVFSSLFKAFGPSGAKAFQDSPFEPTPLISNSTTTSSCISPFEPTPLPEEPTTDETASFGSLQDDWEPFPLSMVV